MGPQGSRGDVGVRTGLDSPRWPSGLAALAAAVFVAALVGVGAGDAQSAGTLDGLTSEVSCNLTDVTLPKALVQLGNQANVGLGCGSAFERRRILLHVKQRPLKEVLEQVAFFMRESDGDPTWIRGTKQGRPFYRLQEDALTRRARRNMIDRRNLAFVSRLKLACEAAAMSDADLEKLRARAPELAHAPPRWSMSILNGLPPDVTHLARQKGSVLIPYPQLPPSVREFVRVAVRRQRLSIGSSRPDVPRIEFDGRKDYGKVQVRIGLTDTPARPSLEVSIATTSRTGIASGSALYPSLPPEERQPEWMKQELKRVKAGERPAENSLGHRALDRLVTIREWTVTRLADGRERRYSLGCPMALDQLARQIELPLIADYDPAPYDYYQKSIRRTLKRDLEKLPAREALEVFRNSWNVRPSLHNEWLHVRSDASRFSAWDGLVLP